MTVLPHDPSSDTPHLPEALLELVQDLADLSPTERMDLLTELADELPPPPPQLAGDPGFERVEECQSPVNVLAQVRDETVSMHVEAPPSATATRALAAILREGVDGEPVAAVLALPADLPLRLGLEGTVSPLRLGGMAGMLARVQRQVRTATR
ncbi:SufE family protein [Arsenicicoccus sp. oral taxon 190]|uniref:SufE family protein n=1 Tax=Arsenicicoccus sp. oral taxon 190 TaxID=1658671 RepID=UPI000679F422|nr:SufE family protein [Arsenicicoccus sp. oral taxon 190]AKT51630.1 hypothetical protein ADJ73_10585 [Arsenicicoccus sp. oral taxon 190]